ncbi:MAG: SCO family protein [Sulfurisoma sp.]|nr:SCO family protein [Sulfurisoma sp.]
MRLPIIFCAALLAACSGGDGGSPPPGHATAGLAGKPVGGDFVLQAAAGTVDTKALRGNVLLVYFGYTNCPDICPASLAAGAQALNALKPEERARTKLILVSVDPERDTPARLKEYVAYFHPAMVGVTGTVAEISAVARAFGVGYVRQPPRPDGGYAVDHGADTYVVGPDGKLAQTIHFAAPAEKVTEAVRKLL